MTFGSLFSGIGGMDLGLERAGMQCLWQVEINDYASRVLEKHWPLVPRHRDIQHVGAALARVDLVCGGFPCQDLSLAGRGGGLEGARSGLWREYLRVVRELRPCVVFMENSPALLARGFGVLLGELAASGYDAEWQCISAQSVGAPHSRDRLFLVAWDVSHPHGEHLRLLAERDQREGRSQGAALCWDSEPLDRSREAWGGTRPELHRVADGIPSRLDRYRGVGNAVVPQVAEFIGRRILEAFSPLGEE